MTIKDIAIAANVSQATVSRIINHKDENISQETRERVLRIIQENGYVPYAKIRNRILSQTRSIGLVVPTLNSSFYVQFASEMQQLARQHNYSLVLALNSGSADAEEATLNDFFRNQTDGVVIISASKPGLRILREMYSQGVGIVAVDHFAKATPVPHLYRDSTEIARMCTQFLLENNCHQIGLVLRSDCPQELCDAIVSGYSAAITAASVPLRRNYILRQDGAFLENFRGMADTGLDGIVCQDADLARMVSTAAINDDLRIPEDLSLVSMEDAMDAADRIPSLTAASSDVAKIARMAFDCLLSQLEHMPLPFSSQKIECPIQIRNSVRSRRNTNPRILVAGYLNTDILLQAPDLPQIGKTQVAAHLADCTGGKGANQAYGIGKLGGNVCLLGRLGSDRRGRYIYENLAQAGVKMDGVSYHPSLPTGTAYISLYPEGKSSVLIDPGANATLDAAYILQNEALLQQADYCLAQTDIPIESVRQLHDLCRKHHVSLVLNWSYGVRLPDELFSGLYVLIIKDQEWQKMHPQFQSQGQCAEHYLSLGVDNVIFTSKGSHCHWYYPNGNQFFHGYSYPSLDETGTSDVFTGCLITLLCEGIPMAKAISGATWAAAYSTTKLGVQNGFPDRKLLEDVLFGNLQVSFLPCKE